MIERIQITMEPLWLTEINKTSIGIKAWISNYIHVKQCDVTIHPLPTFNIGLISLQLKLDMDG